MDFLTRVSVEDCGWAADAAERRTNAEPDRPATAAMPAPYARKRRRDRSEETEESGEFMVSVSRYRNMDGRMCGSRHLQRSPPVIRASRSDNFCACVLMP